MDPWTIVVGLALLAVGAALVYVLVHPPPRPLRFALPAALGSSLLWIVGELGLAPGVEHAEWWIVLLYTGAIWTPCAGWFVSLRFAEAFGRPLSWGRRPWVALPAVFAAMTWIAMLTNPWHGAFLTPHPGARSSYHALWWVHATGSYGVSIVVAGLYLWLRHRHRAWIVRRKATIMIAASLGPLLASFAYVGSPVPPPFDYTVLGLAWSAAFLVMGVYRAGIFNPVPVALPEVIRGEPSAVVLVDPHGYAFYENEAARQLLGNGADGEQTAFARLAARIRRDGPGPALDGERLAWELRPEVDAGKGRIYVDTTGGRWLRARCTPIRTADDQELGHCLRIEDVSEQRLAELDAQEAREYMREAQRLESLGLMAGGIAHDFNNLLTPILGNASVLLEHSHLEGDEREGVVEIEVAARRAADLAHQLLAYAGQAHRTMEDLGLTALVREMEPLLSTAGGRGAELTLDLEENLPLVRADRGQLQQCLTNLVMNAAESLEGPGSIRIATERVLIRPGPTELRPIAGEVGPGSWVALTVRDTGRGIERPLQGRVFDPFFSTKAKGRGLGLSALLGFVRAHGGAVFLESEPGNGTCFRILLPAAGEAHKAAVARDVEARLEDPRGTVLVVDDDAAVRRSAESMLRALGFEVAAAASGRDALERFGKAGDGIRAVLLDVTMPGMSGPDVFKALIERRADIPVICFSGYGIESALAAWPEPGPGAFLAKPFLLEDLHRALAKVLPAGPDG